MGAFLKRPIFLPESPWKPIPPKFGGWRFTSQIWGVNLEITCFTVFFWHSLPNFEGWNLHPPILGGIKWVLMLPSYCLFSVSPGSLLVPLTYSKDSGCVRDTTDTAAERFTFSFKAQDLHSLLQNPGTLLKGSLKGPLKSYWRSSYLSAKTLQNAFIREEKTA